MRKEARLASSQCPSAVITVIEADCGPCSGEPSPQAPPRLLKEPSRARTRASGSTVITMGSLLSLLNWS